MAAIDDFAALLFDEAKAFLEKARTTASPEARTAYLHASLLVGFCSLEAHLNSIADDFLTRPELSLLDRSILSESKIELKDGEYRVTNQLLMFRIEDRIEYLSKRFSTTPLDKRASYWGEFKLAIKLRNELTHPKTPPLVDVDSTKKALEAILELLNTLYRNIYRRGHPSYKLGTDTTMAL
jgi:hypothetical protein